MDTPEIPQKAPYGVELEAGTYWWCACGKSANQPWCDGSHKGGAFSPKKVEITEKKTYWMCGCKLAGNVPFCDGTHKKIDN
jgi:CDGSH iron-sulfur domain-containing protein 3